MDDPKRERLVGQTLGGKYRVLGLIGEGGMGRVFEAEHELTKRVGALKLLHREYAAADRIVQRFVREASAAGRIGSPHVVDILDAGIFATGEPYIFMERLRGETLHARLERRGRLPWPETYALILQAARALTSAHAAGIVHRDIKPENLFICDGSEGFLKLLDFGISKFELVDSWGKLTRTSETIGTPLYMSPEQVRGAGNATARSDIYALAVVLYESVTGRPPFTGSTMGALSLRILSGGAEPPSGIVDDLPTDLDDVLAQAMNVDPGQRFETMDAFAHALASIASQAGTSPAAIVPAPASIEAEVPVAAISVAAGDNTTAGRRSRLARGSLSLGISVLLASAWVWMYLRSSSATEAAPARPLAPHLTSLAPTHHTETAASSPLPASRPSNSSEVARASPLPEAPSRPRTTRAASSATSPTRPSRAEALGVSVENPFASELVGE